MENHKINKRGAMVSPTLFKIFISLLLFIGLFMGLMTFYFDAVIRSGGDVPPEMNESYSEISTRMDTMQGLSEDVRDNALQIEDFFSIETAITSIKGFTQVALLFNEMINIASNSINFGIFGTTGLPLPVWFTTIIMIMIILFVVIAILKVVSGRQHV